MTVKKTSSVTPEVNMLFEFAGGAAGFKKKKKKHVINASQCREKCLHPHYHLI